MPCYWPWVSVSQGWWAWGSGTSWHPVITSNTPGLIHTSTHMCTHTCVRVHTCVFTRACILKKQKQSLGCPLPAPQKHAHLTHAHFLLGFLIWLKRSVFHKPNCTGCRQSGKDAFVLFWQVILLRAARWTATSWRSRRRKTGSGRSGTFRAIRGSHCFWSQR